MPPRTRRNEHMWNLRNWLLIVAISVLCFGLAACAADAPMEETSMEAEPAAEEAAAEAADEAAEESGDSDDGEQGEDAEDGGDDESASEGGASE